MGKQIVSTVDTAVDLAYRSAYALHDQIEIDFKNKLFSRDDVVSRYADKKAFFRPDFIRYGLPKYKVINLIGLLVLDGVLEERAKGIYKNLRK